MATPNYAYEKRQKELAKKRKKEEKQQQKKSQDHNESGETQEPQPVEQDKAD